MLTKGARPVPAATSSLSRESPAAIVRSSVNRPTIFSPTWTRDPIGSFQSRCVSGDSVAGSRANRM